MKRSWTALASVLLVLVPAAAQAQKLEDYDYENLSFRGVGFDVGYIWPTKVEPTASYGIRVDLGYLGPGLRVVPTLTYWSSELKSAELDRLAEQLSSLPALRNRGIVVRGSDLGAVHWSGLALGLDGQYVWVVPGGFLTYLGAGFSAHLLNARGRGIDATFVEDALDALSAGFTALAGIEVEPVRRLRLFGEARYTALSDLRYPGLRFGASFMVPSAAGAATVGSAGTVERGRSAGPR
ncbi:MAG: hypothetical protein DIU52_013585 [bacterium]|jgi:opacity protein-like surface antigen|nr:MAG: hypothetical protein DIU52_13235 [bacterium]